MDQDELEELINEAEDHRAWISKNDIPEPMTIYDEYYDNYFDEDSGLDEKRLREIEKGAKPTKAEYKELFESWRLKAFNEELHDVIIKSMAFVEPAPEKNRKEWLVISTTGTSFEGIDSNIYGRFKTKESAIQSLRKRGLLD